jgi:hypothetical protein
MIAAFQNASRKRAAGAVAAYGVIVAGIVGVFVTPLAALAVVLVTAVVVWRNLVGGLFVTPDSVIVRNLSHTLRLPRSEVAEVTVMAGADDTTGAGYVSVITRDGTCHRATGLRRDPLRGEALAAAIRDQLAQPS